MKKQKHWTLSPEGRATAYLLSAPLPEFVESLGLLGRGVWEKEPILVDDLVLSNMLVLAEALKKRIKDVPLGHFSGPPEEDHLAETLIRRRRIRGRKEVRLKRSELAVMRNYLQDLAALLFVAKASADFG